MVNYDKMSINIKSKGESKIDGEGKTEKILKYFDGLSNYKQGELLNGILKVLSRKDQKNKSKAKTNAGLYGSEEKC